MKFFTILCLIFITAGCSTSHLPDFVEYPTGQPIVVTIGDNIQQHVAGDEFVFSVVLPENDRWTYPRKYPSANKGYIYPHGQVSRRELDMRWEWVAKRFIPNYIKRVDFYFPWYSGIKGDGQRVYYVPTEVDLRYNEWYQSGYPQRQYTQSIYKGHKNYYCIRELTRRVGGSMQDQKNGIPMDGHYIIYDECPFRFRDGRDAYFSLKTSFWITGQQIAENSNIIDEKIAELDAFVQPVWDSLIFSPKAYQFDPPTDDQL